MAKKATPAVPKAASAKPAAAVKPPRKSAAAASAGPMPAPPLPPAKPSTVTFEQLAVQFGKITILRPDMGPIHPLQNYRVLAAAGE